MKKLLFVILLVAGGYFAHKEGWLDGTLLSLHPSMELDLSDLSDQSGENWVLDNYPKLDWNCFKEMSKLGDRACAAPIRRWNGVLAKYTAFFFNKSGKLNMVKFAIPGKEHPKIIETLNTEYGNFGVLPGKKDSNGKSIVIWTAGRGFAVASESPLDTAEAALIWTNGRSVLEQYKRRMAR